MAGNKNSGRRGLQHEKALAEKQRQWRESIQITKILKRFQAYTLGQKENGKDIDLTPQQVQVGLGLLKKALPDLTHATVDGNVTVTHEDEIDAILSHPAAQDEIGKTVGNA